MKSNNIEMFKGKTVEGSENSVEQQVESDNSEKEAE